MTTTFSPLLKIELIGAGGQVNTWGETTNTNLGTLIEQAIAGATTVVLADANVVLTQFDGQADQSRSAMLLIRGVQTQARTVVVPNTTKIYLVRNGTDGGYGVRIQRAAGGSFVEVPPGRAAIVYSDGTDISTAVQYLVNPVIQGGTISSLEAPLAVFSGGTGSNNAELARVNLQAAKSGINSDISGLTGLLTPIGVNSGGTGATNAASARANLAAAGLGVNNDITQITGLTTALAMSQGGTGSALAPSAGAVLYSAAGGTQLTGVGLSGQVLQSSGTGAPAWVPQRAAVSVVVDGNGAAFASGLKGFVQVPFAATIVGVTLLGDTTGSVVVNIWKDTFANFPPTVADSICGSSKPTITSSNKYTDSTLTGWTTSIAANDILAFNVESVISFTKLTIALTIVRA